MTTASTNGWPPAFAKLVDKHSARRKRARIVSYEDLLKAYVPLLDRLLIFVSKEQFGTSTVFDPLLQRLEDRLNGLVDLLMGFETTLKSAPKDKALTASFEELVRLDAVVDVERILIQLAALLTTQAHAGRRVIGGFRKCVTKQAELIAKAQRLSRRFLDRRATVGQALEDLEWLHARLQEDTLELKAR